MVRTKDQDRSKGLGRWPRESIKEQEVVRNRREEEDTKKDLPREADKGRERKTIKVIWKGTERRREERRRVLKTEKICC